MTDTPREASDVSETASGDKFGARETVTDEYICLLLDRCVDTTNTNMEISVGVLTSLLTELYWRREYTVHEIDR